MTLDEMREALAIFAKYTKGGAFPFAASHDEIHFLPDTQPVGADRDRLEDLGFHSYEGSHSWTAFT